MWGAIAKQDKKEPMCILHGVLLYSGDKLLPFRINDRVFHALPLSSLL